MITKLGEAGRIPLDAGKLPAAPDKFSALLVAVVKLLKNAKMSALIVLSIKSTSFHNS